MKVTDVETQVTLATFQLKAEAEVWWESVKTTRRQEAARQDTTSQGTTRQDPVISWETFQQLFLDEYFPAVERRKKKQKFHDLKQKMMSVSQYVAKFNALARFAPGMKLL